MKQIKYIGDYTATEINSCNVLFCNDSNGELCILIKNLYENENLTQYKTDNLEIKINTVLLKEDKKYYFHIVKSVAHEYYSKEQFEILFEYLFNKIEKPISDEDFSSLISSIEEFFKISTDKDSFTLQKGVYGELLILKNFLDRGYNEILEKYHNNFYSKHDLEISKSIRLEVKTTESSKRIHRFKHDQIHRKDCKVFVASSIIEVVKNGYSLFELFENVISKLIDPDMIFSLRKLMKRCGIDREKQGINVSLNLAMEQIKYFEAEKLPQIIFDIPEGISEVSYDVDCSLTESLDIGDLINLFRS